MIFDIHPTRRALWPQQQTNSTQIANAETRPVHRQAGAPERAGRRKGRGLVGLLALLVSALAAGVSAKAQTAQLAGEVTSFGSSLTGAAAVAVDGTQNAYVLTSTGSVYKETFSAAAGTYTEAFLFTDASGSGSGIAVDNAGANIYVGTGTGHAVVRYTGSGTSYAPANTFSGFTGTTTPAVDASGNVYIADASAGTLTKETLSGTTYSAASIATGLSTPKYLAIDAAGNLFVNSGGTALYKVSGSGTTYTKASLGINGLLGIAGLSVDAADDVFVQESTGVIKATLSGGAYATAPYYQYSGQGLTLDSLGNIYLAAATQSSGTKLTVGSGYLNFGSVGPGTPAAMTVAFTLTSTTVGATLGTPTVVTQGLTGYDFTLGSEGTCAGAAAVSGNSCTVVVQFSPQASGSRLGAVNLKTSGGRTIASSFLGGVGFTPVAVYQSTTLLSTISTTLSQGRGITVDPAGNVFVGNSTAAQILKFPAGSNTPIVFPTSNTCFPVSTAVDGEGNVFFTCNGETNMYELVGGAGTPVQIPVGYTTDDHLSVDAAGNLYPTSYQPGNYFLKVAAGTHTVSVIATAPASARFVGAVTDAAGNTFAPDYNNDILYELPAGSNTLTTLFTGAPLQAPHAIAEDAAGNLYVTTTTPNTAGQGSSNLLRFTAGNYTAKPAQISVPGGDSLFITPDGNFYTVYQNNTLAVYSRSEFSLAFANTAVGQTSATQAVTLENDGAAPLTVAPPSSGTNPSISANFSFDPSSTCPQLSSNSAPATLLAGGSCTDVVAFAPRQVGTISGSMVTTDNSANVPGSTQVIHLSGTSTQGTPTVTVANSSGMLGQNVTLTATVSGGGVVPTGGISFTVGSGPAVAGTCTVGATSETCTASYSTSAGFSAGASTITATVAADTNYLGANGTGTLTLNPASTTSVVTSSLNPSTFGAAVLLTGRVTSSFGTPTGVVTFLDGTTSLGTVTLGGTGTASLSISTLSVGTHPITISYGGATNFAASSSSPALSQVVNKATAFSNALTSSNTSSTFGASVTFTDSLGTLGGVTPTGTVTFFNGGTQIGTGTVDGTGKATLTTTTLPVGTDQITATYSGDGNYATSNAGPLPESVAQASGYTNTLTTSNATPSFGSSVTFTDTLPVLGGVAPTGSVTFLNGTTTLGTGTINASGVATLTTPNLPVGSDSVTASYVGDSNYVKSTSNAVTEAVAKASGYGDVLTSSNAAPTFGSSVTLTTTLSPVNGVYPTGSVTFLNGTTSIGTGAINASGVATLTTTTLPVGSDAITSSYTGDGNFAAATSNAVTESVTKATVPSDVLTSSNLSPAFGAGVTLTDTLGAVSGTYPTGTVTFFNGSTQIGTGSVSATGVATVSVSTLPVGTDAITAVYNGDTGFNSATSNQVNETVSKANVGSDVLTTSNASPAFGTSVTLTDTLSAVNGAYPSGTITFLNGGTAIGTGTISASGVATLTLSTLPVGADMITASFGGDNTFNSATSNGVTEMVAKATGYGNVLSTSNASPTFGSAITLTDTLAAVNGTYPTGTVQFLNGSAVLGTGTINASGVATLSVSTLPVGSNTITTTYAGDGNFASSASNAITETVGKAIVGSHVLTSSNANPAFGASITLTDTLSAAAGSYPSGTITFLNGTTAIGTGTISASGVATLTIATLPVGSDAITASFPGDATFAASTSNVVTETVAKASGYSDVLTTSNASPGFGASVTLTDTIAAVNGTYPTGTVTFSNGTTVLGTGTLNASGVATLLTAALPAGTDSVTAGYVGDATFAAATSNAVTETVSKASGYPDVLSTSNSSPAFGTSITLTDTLAAVNGVYPTGTVTFLNGTTSIGTGTLSATGVATLTISTLPVGADPITASYAGDTTFVAATSNQVTENVAKASGYGDVLTSSNLSPSFGASVALTDTLAAVNGVYPTGTVTFLNGTTSLGTGTISASGVATLTVSNLPVGTDAITASYSGDRTFGSAISNAVTEMVAKSAVPSDVLATSNGNPAFGGSVTLTDTLASSNGAYPTGTITFLSGGTSIGTGTLSGTGVATLTLSNLPAGTNTITATYPGDASFSSATSNAITETVTKATASNALTTSNQSPAFGVPVTLTDTLGMLNGVTPTGSVNFYSGATLLGSGTVNGSGVASLSTSALPVGTDAVTAVYAGDATYNGSTSNAVNETVAKASGYPDVLSASTTTPSFGQTVTLTDTLGTVNGAAPTGTVTFFNGTTSLGTGTLNGAGTATLATAALPTGTASVTAVYGGDGNFSNASSNAVSIAVGKVPASSNDTVTGSGTYGAATTSVAVTIPYPGTTAPTGAITVTDTHGNTLTIQASTCTSSGGALNCTGNLPTANDPAGSNAVSVSQAADTNFAGSTGSGNITLSKAAATTGDTATGTGTYGAATSPFTVTIPYAGQSAPGGVITVSDAHGNTATPQLSGCTASSGVLSCTGTLPTANEPVGSNALAVSQAADANYSGSVGSGTMTIGKAPATTNDAASGTGTYGAANTPVAVTIPYAGTVPPSGAVTLTDTRGNTVTVQASSCSASGGTLSCTATLPTASEPVGANAVTVSQAGDSNYNGSTGSGTVTISKAASSTADSATGSGLYGAPSTPVQITLPYTGTTPPTGAITLTDTHSNTVTIQATACAANSGVLTCTATLPTANEPVGANLVTVNQAPDSNYGGSTGSGTVTISKAAVTSNDTANGSGTYGAATTPVSISIPFAGVAPPTGQISVKDSFGNTVAVGASSCSATGGTLSCTANLPTANEPVGSNPVTVSQNGDANYSGSTGSGVVTIGKALASSADTASGNGTYGAATTSVLVTIPYAGAVAPSGAITVADTLGNTVAIQASTCVASGGALTCTASLPTANEPAGANAVTVAQAGDANYLGSTGAGSITINQTGARGDDSATGTGFYGAASTPITVVIPFSGASSPTGTISVADNFGNAVNIAPSTCKTTSSALVCSATLATSNEPVGNNPVSVTQAADPNHASSTGSGTITIHQAPATAPDTVSGTGTYGAPTTPVTATIPYAGVAAPTGTITVADGLGNQASVPAASCTAGAQTLSCVVNLPTANEPLGANQVTVTQAADSNYAASTGTGSVTLAASAVSPIAGTASFIQNITITQGTQSTLLTATIAYGGASAPTGAVSFTVGAGLSVAATCSTGPTPQICTAMYPTGSLPVGTYVITASQAADANYAAGSATATLTVATGSVSPILDSVSNVSNVLVTAGTQSATLTANITYNGPLPTGALTFTLPGGAPVTATCTTGPSPLSCTASYPTASLAVGSYIITATDAADGNYPQGEASALLTVEANASTPVSPLLATGSSVSSVLVSYGTPTANLYATIVYNGPAPTGQVTFSVAGGTGVAVQAVCSSGPSPLTCMAVYPTASLGIGGYRIEADIAADGNYPAGSAVGTLTVSEVAASNQDTVTGTGTYGSPTTPITVTIPYAGSTAPSGDITVTDSASNTVTIPAATCTANNGVLSCASNLATLSVAAGTDAATVSQAADAVYAASSGTGTITINKAPATSADTATGTGSYGAAATAVTVTIPYAGPVAPSGTITVSDSLGNTVTLQASGCTAAASTLTCTGNLPTANEPVGANPATVTQAGDANYSVSTGTGTITINKAAATANDNAAGTGTFGSPTTAVNVTIPYAGSNAPSGAVTVSDAHGNTVTVPASTCTASAGVLSCAMSLPTANEPVGSNALTVAQAADANYAGSTGGGSVTINKAAATSGDTATGTSSYGAATTPATISIPYAGATAPAGAITLTDTHGNTVTIAAASCTAGAGVLSCTATLPTASEPVGANAVTVSQAADANYSGSTGAGTITITKAPATATDTAAGTGTFGAATTPVTITIPFAGAVAPTGAVTLADAFGNTATVPGLSCTASNGTLSCLANLSTLNEPLGSNPVTVTQVGDANYTGSTGSGFVTISKAIAGADSVSGTGSYGAATTPITVTIPYVGTAAPTGTITVTDANGNSVTVTRCSPTGGALSCSANFPSANDPVGANPVTVTQAADANHSASTGSGTLTLNKAPATTTDTAVGSGTMGAATTPVTVTIPYAGVAAPAGAITVADTLGNTVTVLASSCKAAAGTLTCTANLATANEALGANQLTVAQAPDANYSGSTGTGTLTLSKPGAGNGDTASGSGTYGAPTTPVTITVPITGSASPTGAITLSDSYGNTVTVQATTCSVSKTALTCPATLPTANEPTGSNPVTVSQAPDAVSSGSTGTGTVVINKAPITANDTLKGTATYGAPSTAVTVSIPFTGAAAPSGAITVSDTLGNTVTLQASSCTVGKGVLTCTANLPTANEPAGANALTVSQAADANYSGSTGSGSLTVSKATPTLSAPTVAPLNSAVGTSVTLTQTVPAGETGTVTFYSGTTSLGTATISNGVATLTTSALSQGANVITATANGDANYGAATSPAVTDMVGSAAAKIALSSSQSTSSLGTPVTFTAALTVSPTSPITGSVTFYDGNTVLGTAPVSNGAATLSTAALTVGTHAITASFTPAPGSVVASATSPALTQTVQAAGSSVALTSSLNPAVVEQSVTFSATVPATFAGAAPTGMVTFMNGTTVLGKIPLNSAGVANFSTSSLKGGVQNITASYAGDSNYAAAVSAPIIQKISDYSVGNTTPTLTVDPGAAASFNITVSPVAGVGFVSPVTLTVAGLPANFTSSFGTGTSTPGTGGTTSSMTVQTFAQALTAMQHEQHLKSFETAAVWACLLPLLGLGRVRRRLPKALLTVLVCLASFGVIAPLTGCGGGYFGPAPTTYTLTVTGTSGTLQRSTTVTLNVR